MEKINSGPRHIAVIMDGNGRWAEQHHMTRAEGHRAGAETVKNLIANLKNTTVEYVTLYAFSTENWKRSKDEVNSLMNILSEFIDANLPVLMENRLRLMVTGRIDGLPEKPRRKLASAIRKTSVNTGKTLIFALNYGGRMEIADAARQIARDAINGKIDADKIDENLFAKYLYHPEVPDPDLLIRTAGEMRLSNFLLWELSYTEIYVTKTFWPDFDVTELNKALAAYGKRTRRFGGRV